MSVKMPAPSPELPRRHLTTRQTLRQPPKLPVVNVIPFLSERQDTWCKDKSLPEFYEKPDVVLTSTEACMKPPLTALSTYSDSSLIVNENRPILPLAQSNRPNIYDDTISEASSVPSEGRQRKIPVMPSSPRIECISPDRAIKKIPKHGFAPTIVDREKKTFKDSPTTKPTSLLNREKTDEFISKQQVMNLKGRKMMEASFASHNNSINFHKAGTMMPMRSLEDFYRHLVNSYNRGYAFSPTKSRISHHTDAVAQSNPELGRIKPRNPLLSLNHESVGEKLHSYKDMSDSKSAFRVLNSSGKPTSVEKNLARSYTFMADQNKLKTPQPNSGQHFTRYLKLKNYNPTQGELFLMVNREQNRPGHWRPDYIQKNVSSHRSEADSKNWFLAADERDIQVSPDLVATMTPVDQTHDIATPKPINNSTPGDLPAESLLGNSTRQGDSSSTLPNLTDNPSSSANIHSSTPIEDNQSRSANISRSEERIAIKTVLPDIHDNAFPEE